jgi:hypothetical protein
MYPRVASVDPLHMETDTVLTIACIDEEQGRNYGRYWGERDGVYGICCQPTVVIF